MRFLKYCWLLLVVLTILPLVACDQNQPPAAGSAASQPGAAIGAPAPDFVLTDLHGQKVALSQFRGKVVLVNFWATWCPPCREEMPSMEQFYRRFQEQGLVLLAVNIEEDGDATVPRFLQGKGYSFPILLDTAAEVQNRYQVFRFPETFVIDRNGNIVARVIGARNWMSESIVKRINFMLNG